MRLRRILPLVGCAIAVLAAVPAGAETGKEIFGKSCTACHGPGALGNPALGAPALAGQDGTYLERQLRNFRTGLRGTDPRDTFGNQMRAASTVLADDQAIAAVAAYLASLAPPVVKPVAGANLKNGNNFYQGKCGACHGGRAEGIAALSAPRLSGLDAAYMTRQFHDFQQGIRGSSPKDRYGRQMTMMAATVPGDSDLADVIAFIHSLGSAKQR